jgi:hypothetical protein
MKFVDISIESFHTMQLVMQYHQIHYSILLPMEEVAFANCTSFVIWNGLEHAQQSIANCTLAP